MVPAIGLGVLMECLHAGIGLALIRPFPAAVEIVTTSVPQMLIAVSLGVGIAIIIVQDVLREEAWESARRND
ncbi:MAG: LytS/YhcK type 5TM receptor domain-containing protein [Methanolinea sp.]|nr:LytS/YhcK type 5TM receptor domain-containing protein [Methanolinea sp.]